MTFVILQNSEKSLADPQGELTKRDMTSFHKVVCGEHD